MIVVSMLRGDLEVAASLAADGCAQAALRRRVAARDSIAMTVKRLVVDACDIAGVEPAAIERVVHVTRDGGSSHQVVDDVSVRSKAHQSEVHSVDALLRLVGAWAPSGAALLVVD